jgi:hypothetical protein
MRKVTKAEKMKKKHRKPKAEIASAPNAGKRRRKNARGRPRIEFDQKIADRILALTAQGVSLERICRRKKIPSIDTVHRWRRENEVFARAFACAREDKGDTLADRVQDLADETTPENAHAYRVKIEAIRWAAGAHNVRYNDRATTAVQVNVGERMRSDLDQLEIARRLGHLLAQGAHAAERLQIARLPAPSQQGERPISPAESQPAGESMKQGTERPGETPTGTPRLEYIPVARRSREVLERMSVQTLEAQLAAEAGVDEQSDSEVLRSIRAEDALIEADRPVVGRPRIRGRAVSLPSSYKVGHKHKPWTSG